MASTYEAYLLAQLAGLVIPVTVAPASTSASGTASSGTTEVFDAVLGYYSCNLISGRRYLAIMNGLGVSGTVAADLYEMQIRNSGTSSNPTTSSTSVASGRYYVSAAGGGGAQSMALAGSFIAPANGLNTFGMSITRIGGSGVGTPVLQRELYVMYLGVV
jgi:hypothetical protein